MYERDGFLFYDPSSEMHLTVGRHGIRSLHSNTNPAAHAVRVYLEYAPAPGVHNGPFYKPLGEYYILRTERYLPRAQWARVPQEVRVSLSCFPP